MAEYVERKAYLDYLAETLIPRMPSTFANGIWAAYNTARDFPAADVAPVRHGEWGNAYYDDEEGEFMRDCSVCGKPHRELSPYCPNCGARMDGELR